MPAFPVLIALALAAPEGPAVSPPRLARGDELVFRGEVTEAGERIGNRFRKVSELEVRVLVLETVHGFTDCAVITKVRAKPDPVVTGAVQAVTGADPVRMAAPSVRVELVRVDSRGRARLLAPKAGPPPVPIAADTPTLAAPPMPLDAPPILELGMFIPLPVKMVKGGDQWDTPDPDRPPIGWWAIREAVWNGSRCVEVQVSQQTDGFDKPATTPTGWRRREAILANPTDGYACAIRRIIERREGKDIVGWLDVKLELQPPTRYVGARFTDVRREAEAAYCFAVDLATVLAKSKATPSDFHIRGQKIDQFVADYPLTGGFRDAIEAVRRRCKAGAEGESVPTAVITAAYTARPEPPEVGKPAPDFLAPRLGTGTKPYRLAGSKGKPVLLVFFKPEEELSAASLIVTEALHKRFAGKADVVALAIGSNAVEAGKRQRDFLKLTYPVLDGTTIRDRYAVDSFPRFFLVDQTGGLFWQFEGYGNETGSLAKKKLEQLLPK